MQDYLIVKGQIDPIENENAPEIYKANEWQKLDKIFRATIRMHLSESVYFTVQSLENLLTTLRLCSCGGSTLVASAPTPGTTRRHVGGMGRRSRLEFVSIPSLGGGRVDWYPSFSLSFLIVYRYLMLTIDISSNTSSVVDWVVHS